MNDFPGTGRRPDDEGAPDGFDFTSFDPLLTPFETPAQRAQRPLDFDDSLYLGANAPQSSSASFADEGLDREPSAPQR